MYYILHTYFGKAITRTNSKNPSIVSETNLLWMVEIIIFCQHWEFRQRLQYKSYYHLKMKECHCFKWSFLEISWQLHLHSWRREWQPTPGFLPREFHGLRSLVNYSSWDHKESDPTEQLSLSHTHTHTHTHTLFHSYTHTHTLLHSY